MAPSNRIGVAIVGCGNIAETYARQIQQYPRVSLIGFYDLDAARATDFAARYDGKSYSDLDALLADPAVEVVVNLTIHHAHVVVITASLEAGKHVYTEKPLALSYADAQRLLALAENQGLRLSSAPITYLGEAQQTIWQRLREKRIGPVRLAYAELNHGRIETWHPNPVPFYDVGVVWDVGIYPITLLTAFLGPVEKVTAFGKVLFPDRVTLGGEPFRITTPDMVVALLEFQSGTLARVSCNFYTTTSRQGASLEFHGDNGSLYLGNCFAFDAPLACATGEDDFETLTPCREPFAGTEFGRGLKEFANAILDDRPARASAEHAAHVIEIIEAIHQSIETGKPVALTSDFVLPQPMDWAV